MERNVGEDFDDYKARRAASNKARDEINLYARSHGGESSRAKSRLKSKSVGIKGIRYTNMTPFGAAFAASRANRRATPWLLEGHKQHLRKAEARRQARSEARVS